MTLWSPYLSLCKKFLSFRLLAVPVGAPIRVLLQHDIFIDIFSGIRIACVSSIESTFRWSTHRTSCRKYIQEDDNTLPLKLGDSTMSCVRHSLHTWNRQEGQPHDELVMVSPPCQHPWRRHMRLPFQAHGRASPTPQHPSSLDVMPSATPTAYIYESSIVFSLALRLPALWWPNEHVHNCTGKASTQRTAQEARLGRAPTTSHRE